MDRAPGLQDIPNQTKDKPAPAGTPFDYKEIAREVLARGAPMDRAPSLQDIANHTRDKPAPAGTAFDYKEMAREVLARIDQRLADLGADTPPDASEEESDASEEEFHSETASSLMTSGDQAAIVRWAWRGLIGLLLSAGLVAAISFLWSHGETTQSVAQPVVDSTVTAEKSEPGPPAAARATADAAPAQAAPPSRSMPDYDKPTPAPVPPELTELMRKVDRNIAGLAQAVTDLRLAHQQATGDNVKSVEDIRASLEQMTRAMATTATPDARAPDQVMQARPQSQLTLVKPPAQVTQARPAAQVTQAKLPTQVAPTKPLTQITQARPAAPAPQPAARRNRRYVPPYLSPSDALGFMR